VSAASPGAGGPGPLALVGGGEWTPGASFDAELVRAGGPEVLILPTAAAYQRPERAVARAEEYFAGLGARARGLMVLSRRDAQDPEAASAVARSRFVYLSGGSALHLRSVLKGSAVWSALLEAWESGAVVAASSAGAMVLTDPMVDPRGGAFTLGLGLVEQLAVIPHYGAPGDEKVHRRTLALAAPGLPVACIPERSALIRWPGGTWVSAGESEVQVFVDGAPASLEALPGWGRPLSSG